MPHRRTSPIGHGITVRWLGHSAFVITSPEGKVVYVDPWLDNPKAPADVREISRADLILVTHGHGDHIGNTVEIAQSTGAHVVAIYEISKYFEREGLTQITGLNKSGSTELAGVDITMVHADHSSGIEPGGDFQVGGDPAGFIIRFPDGFTIYHAGDTGLFGDMHLIGELYHPTLALLPIGGKFTMGPLEAAKACELIKPKHILGMHYGTYAALTGTPAELMRHLSPTMRKRVHVLEPGGSLLL